MYQMKTNEDKDDIRSHVSAEEEEEEDEDEDEGQMFAVWW